MGLMSVSRFRTTMHLYIKVIDFQLGLFRVSAKPSCSIAPFHNKRWSLGVQNSQTHLVF